MYEVRENNDESVLKFKLVLETIKGIKDTEWTPPKKLIEVAMPIKNIGRKCERQIY
jgi:hypothetical protein